MHQHPVRIKVTSYEIAQYMLKENRHLSAPDVANAMRRLHPDRIVDVNEVYARLRRFTISDNAVCIVNTAVRPRTFKLVSIDKYFFKGQLKRAQNALGGCGVPNIPHVATRPTGEACEVSTLYQLAGAARKMDDLFRSRSSL